MDKEENTYSKRFMRYGKVGSNLGIAAARVALSKVMNEKSLEKNAIAVTSALGDIKGPIMKIAQILSTIPGAVPAKYADELSKLQNNAPSMGWGFVNRRMKAELGKDWQGKFKSFDKEACAAASLGQVHKGEDLKGNVVACKLQYPDMSSAVEADLKQLDLLFSINKRFDPAILTGQIKKEIAIRLREELDYEREANHLDLYRAMLKDHKDIKIPNVERELSTKRLLTMTWQQGVHLLSYKNSSQEIRNKIGDMLFRAWWIPFGQYGVIHGDPHLGNYTIIEKNNQVTGLNLLDFGCVRRFEPSFVKGVVDLYNGLLLNKRDQVISAYETWGFSDLKNETIEILNIWARFVYGPLLDNRIRTISDGTSPNSYGRKEAFEVYTALKKIGPIEIPREFVFMDRAAIGLGAVFLHLDAKLNLHDLFEKAIGDFDEKRLKSRQNKIFIKTNVNYGD